MKRHIYKTRKSRKSVTRKGHVKKSRKSRKSVSRKRSVKKSRKTKKVKNKKSRKSIIKNRKKSRTKTNRKRKYKLKSKRTYNFTNFGQITVSSFNLQELCYYTNRKYNTGASLDDNEIIKKLLVNLKINGEYTDIMFLQEVVEKEVNCNCEIGRAHV